jgi:DNA polymerase-3 subunit delta'
MSRAIGLADPKLEQFRRELIDQLALEQGFDPSELAGRMLAFVREGAKEASVQRRRATLLVGELARLFRGVLWQTARREPPCPDPADRLAALTLASRLEPEDVFLLAQRCMDAAYHLERNLYLPTVLESLFHDLGKLINVAVRT